MKQSHQSVAMAGLLAVALAISGCAAMRGGESSKGASGASGSTGSNDYGAGASGSSGSSGTSGSSGATTESIQDGTGSSGTAGSSGSGTSSMQDDRGGSASTAGAGAAGAAPNSTVLAIEILPGAVGITEGDSSMGSSGASGATGSSSGGGQSYRVTVRMDDGSTQVVTHNTTPDFRSGDRVNVTSGSIQR